MKYVSQYLGSIIKYTLTLGNNQFDKLGFLPKDALNSSEFFFGWKFDWIFSFKVSCLVLLSVG